MRNKLKKTKGLVISMDGVLTDGKQYFTNTGGESISVCSRDIFGLKLLIDNGIIPGVIMPKGSLSMSMKLKDMGVKYIASADINKLMAYKQIIKEMAIGEDSVTYIGNELDDLPIFNRVGLSITVHTSDILIMGSCSYMTKSHRGEGALREVCEMILVEQGKMSKIIDKYMNQ